MSKKKCLKLPIFLARCTGVTFANKIHYNGGGKKFKRCIKLGITLASNLVMYA